jgi:TonB family protein
MTPRITGLIAALLLLQGAQALADCTRPRPAFEIPDGAVSSQQDIASAQQQLVTFAAQVREYLRCLNGEASQKSIGKDDASREQLARAHLVAHQEAADELSGLAECFNAQVQSFKSSGGGTQKRAADCSSFITAAAKRARPNTPVTSQLVVESSGRTVEIPGGSWLYYLVRDDSARRCAQQQECLYRAIHVRNDSDDVLECKAEITYEGTDIAGNATAHAKALVSERTTYVVLESLAKQGVNAQTFDASCTPRAKLPPLDTPASCKYEVVTPVAIGDYYPPAAREAGEEGPVTVEFTLSNKPGRPTNVRTVASSMVESLDQAAVKAVGDMVMSSNCPKGRYRLKLSFQLEQ